MYIKNDIAYKVVIIIFTILNLTIAQSQYPSPMVEHSRSHERIKQVEFEGRSIIIEDVLTKPIEVYIPNGDYENKSLIIHFHGASYISRFAVEQYEQPYVLAVVNLGHGSSAYEKPFLNNNKFDEVISVISDSTNFQFSNIYITSFSAGYGSVRALLNNPKYFDMIDGVILIDGLHTDYIPEKVTLADGGILNTEKMECFLKFADQAVCGEKSLVITHSEIFPGTYASTTETANYLINELGLKRKSALNWGVLGMQQTSEVISGNFRIFGFAGNSAPDHIDHIHALYNYLQYLE